MKFLFRWLIMAIGCCAPVLAVDGVVLIDQARAQAGNVTPGDIPGFPISITLPGSYRLSGNLIVTSPETSAIEISASGVTLDLNGFSVTGPPGSCSNEFVCERAGIQISPLGVPREGIKVGHGRIVGFTSQLSMQQATMGKFEDLVFVEPPGTVYRGANSIGAKNVVRQVITAHSLYVACPGSIIVESSATAFLLGGGVGCIVSNSTGLIF